MNALLKVFGATIWGASAGFFLFGLCGLLVSGLGELTLQKLDADVSGWLQVVIALVAPLAMSATGAYLIALRNGLAATVEVFIEKDITARLYARVRPALLRVANKLRERAEPLSQTNLAQSVRESFAQETCPNDATSWRDRIVWQATRKIDAALARLLVDGNGQILDREAALAKLESTSIGRLEAMIAEMIERLFQTQFVLLTIALFVVCAAPYLALWALW